MVGSAMEHKVLAISSPAGREKWGQFMKRDAIGAGAG
jgi:hypothetical protein